MAFYAWDDFDLITTGKIVKFQIKDKIYPYAEFAEIVEVKIHSIASAVLRAKKDRDTFVLLMMDNIYRRHHGLSFRATIYRRNGVALHSGIVRDVTGLSEFGANHRLRQWIAGDRTLPAVFDPPRNTAARDPSKSTFSTCKVDSPRRNVSDIPMGTWEADRLKRAESFATTKNNINQGRIIPDVPLSDRGAFVFCPSKGE